MFSELLSNRTTSIPPGFFPTAESSQQASFRTSCPKDSEEESLQRCWNHNHGWENIMVTAADGLEQIAAPGILRWGGHARPLRMTPRGGGFSTIKPGVFSELLFNRTTSIPPGFFPTAE